LRNPPPTIIPLKPQSIKRISPTKPFFDEAWKPDDLKELAR
jgi:hypothetical protein